MCVKGESHKNNIYVERTVSTVDQKYIALWDDFIFEAAEYLLFFNISQWNCQCDIKFQLEIANDVAYKAQNQILLGHREWE